MECFQQDDQYEQSCLSYSFPMVFVHVYSMRGLVKGYVRSTALQNISDDLLAKNDKISTFRAHYR